MNKNHLGEDDIGIRFVTPALRRFQVVSKRRPYNHYCNSGMMRFMKPSNSGTVNVVSPCEGLYTMPF